MHIAHQYTVVVIRCTLALFAVLLLRSYTHRLRSTPPLSFTVFLITIVVLVGQHARVTKAHMELRVLVSSMAR